MLVKLENIDQLQKFVYDQFDSTLETMNGIKIEYIEREPEEEISEIIKCYSLNLKKGR